MTLSLLVNVAVSNESLAQFYFNDLELTDFNYETKTIDTSIINKASLKINSLMLLINKSFEYTIPNPIDSFSSFYQTDLDGDNQVDNIYSGRVVGLEGSYTIIGFSSSTESRPFHVFSGNLIAHSQKGDIIAVSEMGCCGSDVDWTNLYKLENNGFKQIHHIKEFWTIKPPVNKLNSVTSFEITRTPYYLRSSPIIMNKADSSDIDRYGVIEGNILKKLSSGDRGYAVAHSIDDTGRIWWYVVITNHKKSDYDIVGGWGNELDPIAGWISSRFIKKLP